jgi:hypothetical protein
MKSYIFSLLIQKEREEKRRQNGDKRNKSINTDVNKREKTTNSAVPITGQ